MSENSAASMRMSASNGSASSSLIGAGAGGRRRRRSRRRRRRARESPCRLLPPDEAILILSRPSSARPTLIRAVTPRPTRCRTRSRVGVAAALAAGHSRRRPRRLSSPPGSLDTDAPRARALAPRGDLGVRDVSQGRHRRPDDPARRRTFPPDLACSKGDVAKATARHDDSAGVLRGGSTARR